MIPKDTSDRADATVWLPLLNILGGVAERVAGRRSDDPPDGQAKAGARTPAEPGKAA